MDNDLEMYFNKKKNAVSCISIAEYLKNNEVLKQMRGAVNNALVDEDLTQWLLKNKNVGFVKAGVKYAYSIDSIKKGVREQEKLLKTDVPVITEKKVSL